MRGRLVIIVIALGAVAIAFLLRPDNRAEERAVKLPAGTVRVPFVYSPEKEALLLPLVKRFNASGRVHIDAVNVASGDAETRIARGTLKPVAWTPSSSLWARLLDFEADRALAPDKNPSIVRTPLVIAMWEPMARALGWP